MTDINAALDAHIRTLDVAALRRKFLERVGPDFRQDESEEPDEELRHAAVGSGRLSHGQ